MPSEGSSQSGAQPPPLDPVPRSVACRSCRAYIDPGFAYCPYCGKRQDEGNAWYFHPVWILTLAFVALGPIALPLVWKSRRMNAAAKAVMTAAILVYTAFCVYSAYKIVMIELQYFSQFEGLL